MAVMTKGLKECEVANEVICWDENFTHLEAYIGHERRISGWNVDLGDGGSYDYAFSDGLN